MVYLLPDQTSSYLSRDPKVREWLEVYSVGYRYRLPHCFQVETFRSWGFLASFGDISYLVLVNILAWLEDKALCMVMVACLMSRKEERKASTERERGLVSIPSPPAATSDELRGKLPVESCVGRGLETPSCCMVHSYTRESTKPGISLK